MKAKQLPSGLDEWLKTRTVVIGGVNWPRPMKTGVPKSQRQREDTGAVVNRKDSSDLRRIKLVPRSQIRAATPGCCARPKSQSR